VACGSVFAFLCLFALDTFGRASNPYVGILTYFIAPGFLISGLGIAWLGVVLRRRQLGHSEPLLNSIRFDFSRPNDRKVAMIALFGGGGFLVLSAFGSYHTYHFTESVTFCGEACHTVMKPERVAYQQSPHARVSCTQCHIGPGATWFVRSKLSGAYQVYAVLAKKYPTPIPTPVKNLRPARDTCEQCHWPERFSGNIDRTYTHYLSEESNPMHGIRLSLRVGGANPAHGPVEGIHWHVGMSNKVEYVATDDQRQKIPWVRLTDETGKVTEFRTKGFTNDVSQLELRTMDCIDCHNRPAHRYKSPNAAVNQAIQLGKLDVSMPFIKTNAVYALMQEYRTEPEALEKISSILESKYPGSPKAKQAVEAVQQIYKENFFPEMKVTWRAYPENMGHKDWPGCTRCHDDKHVSTDGSKKINFKNCNSCHLILAQGNAKELENMSAKGHEFKHPGDEWDPGFMCSDCHTGGM
jgi:hypothetical protein